MTDLITAYRNTEYVLGENDTPLYTSLAESPEDIQGFLAEYFQIMRGTPNLEIKKIIQSILANCIPHNGFKDYKSICDLIKIILFVREPRYGKGERDVTYMALIELFNYLPKSTIYVIQKLGIFGYYKDMVNIYNHSLCNNELKEQVVKIMVDVLKCDMSKLMVGNNITLAAKWFPTERSDKELVKKLASQLFYGVRMNEKLRIYRNLITKLRSKLNLVENNLCKNTTSEINPATIPSKAATLYSKALRNISTSPFPKNHIKSKTHSKNSLKFEEGHKNYEDRMRCRANIDRYLSGGKNMKAGVCDLHKIVDDYFRDINKDIDIIRESQWSARVTEIQELFKQQEINSTLNNDKPTILSIVDLSGSMEQVQKGGICPITVAIMLGLFTSQVQDTPLSEKAPPFANCFFGFSNEPKLFTLPRTSSEDPSKRASLKECIKAISKYTDREFWGMSTNLYKVFTSILQVGINEKVPQDKMPTVIAIYSDMMINDADNGFNNTAYVEIESLYLKYGYKVPHILFWNLRSDTSGYVVKASTPNTTLLSGYSTRMLDLFLKGSFQELASLNDTSESVDINTLTLMNTALEHEMFNDINDELVKIIVNELK